MNVWLRSREKSTLIIFSLGSSTVRYSRICMNWKALLVNGGFVWTNLRFELMISVTFRSWKGRQNCDRQKQRPEFISFLLNSCHIRLSAIEVRSSFSGEHAYKYYPYQQHYRLHLFKNSLAWMNLISSKTIGGMSDFHFSRFITMVLFHRI